ncbi:helix-turn-helix transcriptional regulator [Streptomyces stelliscabiei]|uniref:helix-turn-helix domain-containing protein n=1 Tax=Streptomyces stelliscabiei TaxID=146820 RepID=UPI002FF3327B
MTVIKEGLTVEHRVLVAVLQTLVEASGKSQRKLAAECHMAPATVNHALSGARLPSKPVFESLVRGLGANPLLEPWKGYYQAAETSYAATKTRRGKRRTSSARRALIWTAATLSLILVGTLVAAWAYMKHLNNGIHGAPPSSPNCYARCWPDGVESTTPKSVAEVRSVFVRTYLYEGSLDTTARSVAEPGRPVLVYCTRPGPTPMSMRVLIKYGGEHWYADMQDLRITERLGNGELGSCRSVAS